MTFNTLKHGDFSEIDWMLKGRIGFVAGLTLAIGKATEVDRVLYTYGFEDCCWPG